jgi:roadblock/LC7 domain-containing protein
MQSNVTSQVITSSSTTANFTLQFTSMNNFSALAIPMTLTYTGPSEITCSGSPATPNFQNTIYATVTYTCGLASGVQVGHLTAPGSPRGLWMAEGGTALAFVFLFGMSGRRRKWQSMIGSLALIVVAFGMTGCAASMMYQPLDQLNSSNSNRSTPDAAAVLAPGSYTVIVTGTAAVFTNSQSNTTVNVVHNLPLKIVVQ